MSRARRMFSCVMRPPGLGPALPSRRWAAPLAEAAKSLRRGEQQGQGTGVANGTWGLCLLLQAHLLMHGGNNTDTSLPGLGRGGLGIAKPGRTRGQEK